MTHQFKHASMQGCEKKKLVYFASFAPSPKNSCQIAMAALSVLAFNRENVDILLYTDYQTSDDVKNLLGLQVAQKLNYWCGPHQYAEVIAEASWARYEIFDWPDVENYSTILYLDTDTIVSGDLGPLFDEFNDAQRCKNPIAVLKEGDLIGSQPPEHSMFWGRDIFDFYGYSEEEQMAQSFTTGILLFRNCHSVKTLFSKALKFSRRFVHDFSLNHGAKPHVFNFCDQPSINFLAIRERAVDTSLLSKFCQNNPERRVLIAHFPGGIGSRNKLEKMCGYIFSEINYFIQLLVLSADTLAQIEALELVSTRASLAYSLLIKSLPDDGKMQSSKDVVLAGRINTCNCRMEIVDIGAKIKCRVLNSESQSLSVIQEGLIFSADSPLPAPDQEFEIVLLCGNSHEQHGLLSCATKSIVAVIEASSVGSSVGIVDESRPVSEAPIALQRAFPAKEPLQNLSPSHQETMDTSRSSMYEMRYEFKGLINERVYTGLRKRYGNAVLHGPFQGLNYSVNSTWGDPAQKLLGVYESCLHPLISEWIRCCKNYHVVDFGCAEGYYAAGLSKALESKRTLIADVDPRSITQCTRLINLNSPNTKVRAVDKACPKRLSRFLKDGEVNAVFVCDIEGAEKELFSSDLTIRALRNSYAVIEIHDFVDRQILDEILPRIGDTHVFKVIEEVDVQPSSIVELRDFTGIERALACCESRPEIMRWLALEPKRKSRRIPVFRIAK